jgi:membrane protein
VGRVFSGPKTEHNDGKVVCISTADVMRSARGWLTLPLKEEELRSGRQDSTTISIKCGCPSNQPAFLRIHIVVSCQHSSGTGINLSSIGSSVDPRLNRRERRIWDFVSTSPLRSLWNLQGIPPRVVAVRTWKSIVDDRIFGHAAELGFYFLFALFPTLLSASSILGLAARSASQIYIKLLDYLALVIPTAALGTVLHTFNETTAASSSGKLTFGLIAAFWSASVGISALQDTLNVVYKIEDRRSFIRARIYAIGLTILLTAIISLCLTCMLGGDFVAGWAKHQIHDEFLCSLIIIGARIIGWLLAALFLALAFAVIYYWAPDIRVRCWRSLTPGGLVGIVGWMVASLGLRLYLHFFNNYSVTYGSLGAVIILLTWFYLTGLMLLVGAEINSEIEAAAAELRVDPASASVPPMAN